MGIAIIETDSGTKKKIVKASEKFQLKVTEEIKDKIEDWKMAVYCDAVEKCPKVTGTLAATIRWEPSGYIGGGGEKVVMPLGGEEGETLFDEVLVAGGLLVNPRTGIICNYAEWVHDGVATPYRGAMKRAPQPFLTDALYSNMDALINILIEAYNEGTQEAWSGESSEPQTSEEG